MQPTQKIFSRILESLDRLYDRHCTPADTRDLLLTAADALGDTAESKVLLSAAEAISAYNRPEGPTYDQALRDEGWNTHALAVTAEVRRLVTG